MSDIALKNAEMLREKMLRRIDDLEKEILECREEVKRAERFITEYRAFQTSDPDSAQLQRSMDTSLSETRKRPKNPPKEHVAEVAIEIIRERGMPILRDELFDELAERGVFIHGKNPQMVLSTMLWRQPDAIVRLKRGGYWPAEDELPEGEELATRSSDD